MSSLGTQPIGTSFAGYTVDKTAGLGNATNFCGFCERARLKGRGLNSLIRDDLT